MESNPPTHKPSEPLHIKGGTTEQQLGMAQSIDFDQNESDMDIINKHTYSIVLFLEIKFLLFFLYPGLLNHV